jgi:hypothetical protein
MIRQIGPPHVFLTLSSAEFRWPELLANLKKTVDNEDICISNINTETLPKKERRRLLSSDPVTAARYFDHKLRCMLKLLKEKDTILSDVHVVDSYVRIEFQFRGSPHAHNYVIVV